MVVTGAAGFIGSHTAEALLTRGDSVIGVDNLNDYYDPARKRRNLQELEQAATPASDWRFIEGDLRDLATLERLFTDRPVHAVVHLAAMAGVRASIEQPELYFDENLTGTLRLLEQVCKHGKPNVVFASTSSVYGNTELIPFVETDRCDRPLSPYAASKRSAELLGYSYHHLHELDFTALRLFTVYGPRGRPDMMPFKILSHLFEGAQVPLYDGGQMYRDWTYVGDIVAGLLAAVDRPQGYQIINIGCGTPVLVADFISEVEQVTGKKTSLTPTPRLPTDMVTTHADLTKAKQLLGYEPQVSLREGIGRFWRWYRREVLDQSS